MNARSIFVFFALILAAAVGGCAAPQPHSGASRTVGYGYQSGSPLPQERPIPAGYVNPHTPYMGVHHGRCYYHGAIQPMSVCLNGTAQSQEQSFAGSANGVVPQGMTPERAKDRIAELNQRYSQLCSGENRTKETAISAAIGAAAVGAIGAVTARKGERNEKFAQGALIGGLGGAAVGSGGVVQTCQALYDERRQLQQVVDAGEPRCLDGLKQREVNGVLSTEKSRDCAAIEGKDFERIGQGRAAAPVASQRPVPAPGVVLGGPDLKPPK